MTQLLLQKSWLLPQNVFILYKICWYDTFSTGVLCTANVLPTKHSFAARYVYMIYFLLGLCGEVHVLPQITQLLPQNSPTECIFLHYLCWHLVRLHTYFHLFIFIKITKRPTKAFGSWKKKPQKTPSIPHPWRLIHECSIHQYTINLHWFRQWLTTE